MQLLVLLLTLIPVAIAAPAAITPTVTISYPQATIIGVSGTVEVFPGIPFAKPPVGSLRLRPPQPLTEPLGTYYATSNGKACPQFLFSTVKNDDIPTSALGLLLNTPLFQTVLNTGEDCLNINIHRPAGTTAADKLPVLFWIFGGGFELGWNSMYDGAPWVEDSVEQGKPIIFVTVNYRVGGFGFLPGAEVLADGAANLGLLDQRLGLEWVADNIAAFGGDPDKVTIWGESAGAISVLDQMALYDGDHTYKGKPLFRGAMMNSGSIVPADPVDCPKGQDVYDTVVEAAGCASSSNTLECLRAAPYDTFQNASNSVSGLLSYTSIALSYLPRPDGTALTESPELLIASGRYAKVPFIIGSQEDEGTLFALFQSNITTQAQLVTYLNTIFFHGASKAQIEALVATYPETFFDGSPFRSGLLNNIYPQFKRLAAILGDLTFTLTRRSFLETANALAPDVPSWSYMSSYDLGTPILGTFHGSDLLQVFFGILPNYAAKATRAYYLSFVNALDPNVGSGFTEWPRWSAAKKLINFYPLTSAIINDDFRGDTYSYILKNVGSLHI
ncbi:Alpha/Beta hydrolase protein [Cadophora sp. MPI-SDFR-AT-0126]|nr:Alpha/Beta hydrolase protein [Leotiomycetes sp. MPI-SDFR-AT-0126]